MSVKILKILKKVKTNKIYTILRPILGHSHRSSSSSFRYVGKYDPMPTKYGGKNNVTVVPGIGIGPEITFPALKVLEAAEAPLSFEVLYTADPKALKFDDILISVRRNKVALKANIEIKQDDYFILPRNVLLRKTLDLYVYVVAFNTFPGLQNKFGEIDTVLIRQNTEGEYLMLEHQPTNQSAESLKIITEFNSSRLAKFAFEYAKENNRKVITVAHNSDVHPLAEGVFLKAIKAMALNYPEIQMNIQEVGVVASKMVVNPKLYDVILATNLNGNILSNFLTGMIGGPGLSAGVNLGDSGIAVFEPGARNKGSSIVGTGKANPLAMIMAGIKLLDYLGHKRKAQIIRNSVFATLVYDRTHTEDLGGTATTKEITAKIIEHVQQQLLSKVKLKDRNFEPRWRRYCEVLPSSKMSSSSTKPKKKKKN